MFEKGKTATKQKGETKWKICRPGENIDATGSVTEGCYEAAMQFRSTQESMKER